MTNRIALALALVILAVVMADQALNTGAGMIFLMRRGIAFLDLLAFWR